MPLIRKRIRGLKKANAWWCNFVFDLLPFRSFPIPSSISHPRSHPFPPYHNFFWLSSLSVGRHVGKSRRWDLMRFKVTFLEDSRRLEQCCVARDLRWSWPAWIPVSGSHVHGTTATSFEPAGPLPSSTVNALGTVVLIWDLALVGRVERELEEPFPSFPLPPRVHPSLSEVDVISQSMV